MGHTHPPLGILRRPLNNLFPTYPTANHSFSRTRDRAEKLSAAMVGGEQPRWLGDAASAAARRGEGEGGAGAAASAGDSVLSAGSVRWELHLAARIKEESEKTS